MVVYNVTSFLVRKSKLYICFYMMSWVQTLHLCTSASSWPLFVTKYSLEMFLAVNLWSSKLGEIVVFTFSNRTEPILPCCSPSLNGPSLAGLGLRFHPGPESGLQSLSEPHTAQVSLISLDNWVLVGGCFLFVFLIRARLCLSRSTFLYYILFFFPSPFPKPSLIKWWAK